MNRPAMLRRFVAVAAVVVCLSACAGAANSGSSQSAGCAAGAKQEASEAGLDQITLCLRSGSKTRAFVVEMARTPQQQNQGLMFRTTLADDKGMLFPFPQPRIASFWMRNTLIPLDIIFIGSDGRIVNIAENTTPYSLEPVVSIAPVTAVLELRGGLTAQLGIKAGDAVTWEARKGQ
jgi:uncharacterized protein